LATVQFEYLIETSLKKRQNDCVKKYVELSEDVYNRSSNFFKTLNKSDFSEQSRNDVNLFYSVLKKDY